MYFTERQLNILNFIRGFILERQVSPTLEEIAQYFGISKVTAHEHVRALEKKEALRKAPNRARSIELADDPRDRAPRDGGSTHGPLAPNDSMGDLPVGGTSEPSYSMPGDRSLPVLGVIAAGMPIEAVENREELNLGTWLPVGPDFYVLQVRGDSMVEDGIVDGDLVVVERRQVARDGEVVVALVEGREATLKRLYREGDRVRLQPANSGMEPIYVTDVQVQGVLVGLLRRFDR